MLSVNVLSIVGSIMTFNWAKLIYPECGSKIMLIGVLITLYSIGFACVLILIYSRLNPDTYTCISIRKTHFSKSNWFQWIYVDLGICFIVKYTYRNIHNDCTIKSIFYNSFSLMYTFFLFIYFALFYVRIRNNTVWEKFASLGVPLANLLGLFC